jgi:hypothetical protein
MCQTQILAANTISFQTRIRLRSHVEAMRNSLCSGTSTRDINAREVDAIGLRLHYRAEYRVRPVRRTQPARPHRLLAFEFELALAVRLARPRSQLRNRQIVFKNKPWPIR